MNFPLFSLTRCLSIGLIGLFLLSESACRYEDGPLVPFRSRKKRVVNSWKYERVDLNGLNVTEGQANLAIKYAQSSIGFDHEFRFTTILAYSDLDTAYTKQYNGTWAFLENDEKLQLTYDLPAPITGTVQTWNISRLKEKSLWASEEAGENSYEYKLIPTD